VVFNDASYEFYYVRRMARRWLRERICLEGERRQLAQEKDRWAPPVSGGQAPTRPAIQGTGTT
jgi:hypothetical protein